MSVGVVYLCRGADPNWQQRAARFVRTYQEHPAGLSHGMYVIYKEFEDLGEARNILAPLQPVEIATYVGFNSYAGGSFLEAARHVVEPTVCFLGSTSDIQHDDWLRKLYEAFCLPTVGVVCCTGSYWFITEFNPQLTYPNIHIRNLSFMMERDRYIACASTVDWTPKPGHKIADLNFEHGPNSLTRQVMASGKTVLVVEKDRVRAPHEWDGRTGTTYRGNLHNVLILDRGARDYADI